MEANYLPEGQLLTSAANRDACSSLPMLERAQASGAILEGTALLCDSELNLHIDFPALPGVRGIIPREEAVYTRPGEPVKDIAILTRVGKAVCFKVQGIDTPDAEGLTTVRLSRRAGTCHASGKIRSKIRKLKRSMKTTPRGCHVRLAHPASAGTTV